MSDPSLPTIKRLFAESGNVCAFPGCPIPLIDLASGKVIGRVCHIKARNPQGPRYDPNQSDAERHGFNNLILMCPMHHDVIDADPAKYTVDHLTQIKVQHDVSHRGGSEPSDDIARQLQLNVAITATVSSGSIIYIPNQSGGQTAHSITNNIYMATQGQHAGTVSSKEQWEKQFTQAQQKVRDHYPQGWSQGAGFRQAAWWPEQFVEDRFATNQLRAAAKAAHGADRIWPPFLWFDAVHFPTINVSEGIETTVVIPGQPRPDPKEYPVYDYWKLYESGLFYQASFMEEEYWAVIDHSGAFAYWDRTARYFADAIDCLGRLCTALGMYEEAITLDIRMTQTERRRLRQHSSAGWLSQQYASLSPEFKWRKTHPVTFWRDNSVDLAIQCTQQFLLRFNWNDPPMGSVRTVIQQHLR